MHVLEESTAAASRVDKKGGHHLSRISLVRVSWSGRLHRQPAASDSGKSLRQNNGPGLVNLMFARRVCATVTVSVCIEGNCLQPKHRSTGSAPACSIMQHRFAYGLPVAFMYGGHCPPDRVDTLSMILCQRQRACGGEPQMLRFGLGMCTRQAWVLGHLRCQGGEFRWES